MNFTNTLLTWYASHGRSLPWREAGTPYAVWLSEIILQQTRVVQGEAYWRRFLEKWPTVDLLASASEDEVLRMWQGLGYYSRARNLHAAARQIAALGHFPDTYEAIRGLKGVGDYTAAAIASFAFDLPYAAVDGNAYRVMSRYFGIDTPINDAKGKRTFAELAQSLLPKGRASDFNQAMMDLGAMVCLPNGAPKCEVCPLFDQCLAGRHQTWTEYPFKKSAKPRRIEDRTVLLFLDGTHTAVRKRPKKGLLAGLYEFPNFDGVLSEQEALEEAEKFGVTPLHIQALPPYKHIFSHVEWHITGYAIKIAGNDVEQEGEEKAGLIFADAKTAAERYAIPSAFAEYAKYTDLERA